MASDPFGGGGGGKSSGGGDPFGGGGGGGGGKKKQVASRPKQNVIRALARYVKTSEYKYEPSTDPVVIKALKGMSPHEVRQTSKAAELPQPLVRLFTGYAKTIRDREQAGSGLTPAIETAVNFPLKQLSRPVQGVTSAVAEVSRQGEANPLQVGPISVRFIPTDLGKVATAGKEGLELKRHDTPVSIATEAGRQRAAQGQSVKSFGFLPGTNLLKGEAIPGGTAGKFVYDVGGQMGLDPFTYATFGLGYAAKQGLLESERILGAERAAQIARSGPGVLNAEEKIRLGRDVVARLGGVRGGVALRRPQLIRAAKEGKPLLAPPKTIIPGRVLGADVLKAGIAKSLGSKPGSFLTELFVPRSALRQAERDNLVPIGTADHVETMQATARGTASSAHQRNVAFLRATAKRYKLSPEEAVQVAYALDEGNPETLVGPLRNAFNDVDAYRLKQSGRLRDAGILAEEGKVDLQGNPIGIEDTAHFPHVPRVSGRSFAGEAPRAIERKGIGVTVGGPETPGMGLPAFARKRTGGTLRDELAGGRDFEPNPFAAYAERSREVENVLAKHELTRGMMNLTDNEGNYLVKTLDDVTADLSQKTGEAVSKARLVRELPADQAVVNVPGLGDFVTSKALAPEFKKLVTLRTEDASSKLLRGIDRWMQLWKGYATVPLPFGLGFHMRNGAGNVVLNWLADINPIDPAYAQAARLQTKLRGALKSGDIELASLTARDRVILTEAMHRDIIKGGAFFIEDIPQDTLQAFRSRWAKAGELANPLNTNNALIRSGRAFGLGIEENARLAHFIAKYREFGNWDDAASSVRKYLFDYADLTPFEQQTMKRIIPFYTFTRKNTPLWLGAAFKTPGKYSRLAEWRNAFYDATGRQAQGVMPGYLEEQAAVPSPIQVGGKPTVLAPDLPNIAAGQSLDPLFQLARTGDLESLTPLLNQAGGGAPGAVKAFIEAYAAKKNFFSGKQFYPGEKGDLPGGITLDARTKYLLEQLQPLLPKVESALPADKTEKDRQVRRLISMFTGAQFYPLGKATRQAELSQRAAEINTINASHRRQGKKVPTRTPSNKSSASDPFG